MIEKKSQEKNGVEKSLIATLVDHDDVQLNNPFYNSNFIKYFFVFRFNVKSLALKLPEEYNN